MELVFTSKWELFFKSLTNKTFSHNGNNIKIKTIILNKKINVSIPSKNLINDKSKMIVYVPQFHTDKLNTILDYYDSESNVKVYRNNYEYCDIIGRKLFKFKFNLDKFIMIPNCENITLYINKLIIYEIDGKQFPIFFVNKIREETNDLFTNTIDLDNIITKSTNNKTIYDMEELKKQYRPYFDGKNKYFKKLCNLEIDI
uniref:Uncharacterized protein n=1 Tax=viral metagenome TaxID=1070528 RepID=A0A6C0LSP1_9ZZZZ